MLYVFRIRRNYTTHIHTRTHAANYIKLFSFSSLRIVVDNLTNHRILRKVKIPDTDIFLVFQRADGIFLTKFIIKPGQLCVLPGCTAQRGGSCSSINVARCNALRKKKYARDMCSLVICESK